MDRGIADEVEFWDYSTHRSSYLNPYGVLNLTFSNEQDVKSYMERFGFPDLYIQYGSVGGRSILQCLDGKSFRVYVPCLQSEFTRNPPGNFGAECFLVDAERFLDDRSMLYIPVVHTEHFRPAGCPKVRDFIYLASHYPGKRHDILLSAVRGTELTGHLHPVDGARLDLSGANITTTKWDEADVVELLRTSRIAVYPGDHTSNPAAMWECVATGLPIVVNERIHGGKHLVVSGVTGEFAPERDFYDVMKHVLMHIDAYRPREYFMERWDTIAQLDRYLSFFRTMGWRH